MGALLGGALLSGLGTIARSIVSMKQIREGNQGFKEAMANRPNRIIPEEYENTYARYKQMFAADRPGEKKEIADINQITARARGAAREGAISSSAHGAITGELQQKAIDAIQGAYNRSDQYKQEIAPLLAQAEGQLGQQKIQQWETNKYMPWQTEMNRFGEMKKQGVQNLFGAIQSGVSTMGDFMGTKYLSDAIKGQYPNQNTSAGQTGVGISKPLQGYDPQKNLLNTLSHEMLLLNNKDTFK